MALKYRVLDVLSRSNQNETGQLSARLRQKHTAKSWAETVERIVG